jgi:hypothetical protein
MEVVSINNRDVTDKESAFAVSDLAENLGYLTILAKRPALPPGSLVTAAIHKKTAVQKCGVRLGLLRNQVIIRAISPNSPASMTDLEPGMAIKTVNNVDCSEMTSSEVAKLMAVEEKTLTILAETTASTNLVCRSHIMSIRSMRSIRGMDDSSSRWSSTERSEDNIYVNDDSEKEISSTEPTTVDATLKSTEVATRAVAAQEAPTPETTDSPEQRNPVEEQETAVGGTVAIVGKSQGSASPILEC